MKGQGRPGRHREVNMTMEPGQTMRIPRIAMLLTVLVLSTITASGCVSKVPGTRYGGTYCIQTYYSKAYQDTVKWSSFDYGGYKGYSAGTNGGLCSLQEFHVLFVIWETRAGIHRSEVIDVKPLIRQMRLKWKIPLSFSPPEIRLDIIDRTLWLSYAIYDPDPELDRSRWRIVYPLYGNTE